MDCRRRWKLQQRLASKKFTPTWQKKTMTVAPEGLVVGARTCCSPNKYTPHPCAQQTKTRINTQRDAIERLDAALIARQRAHSHTHTAIKHNARAFAAQLHLGLRWRWARAFERVCVFSAREHNTQCRESNKMQSRPNYMRAQPKI